MHEKPCYYQLLTCDEIVNTSETTSVRLENKINYWLHYVVLLATACLLLLIITVVQYCMKRGLIVPYLLFY